MPKNNLSPVFIPADILLPSAQSDFSQWAVLACDQFTSQPEYWQRVENYVQTSPSTYNIILPEVFLDKPNTPQIIQNIHARMQDYKDQVLSDNISGYIYIRREMQNGKVREGIVGCVDLEQYSYIAGEKPRIRPSEGTIVERIPPRLEVRKGAQLETPHILMLIDDPAHTVVEPLQAKTDRLRPLYNFELMLGGGKISAWAVEDKSDIEDIMGAISKLEDPSVFNAKYSPQGDNNKLSSFALAAGDGNHSLATAKAYWEDCKKNLSPMQLVNHPAQFCLVELENIQSDAIEIEPIHRVVFGVDKHDFVAYLEKQAEKNNCSLVEGLGGEQSFTLVHNTKVADFSIFLPPAPLVVGSVEIFLKTIATDISGASVDYIHGEQDVFSLSGTGAVGILLPDFEKSDLFKGIALGGVLPKKTFSMGHATEKRYYLECRAITK